MRSAPPSPFTVIPWQDDFLQGLLRLALDDTNGGEHIGQASFIFPHSRPKRYLTLRMYREPGLRRPLLMPRMHTVSALFSLLSGRILARPAWQAGLLDRVGLLLDCAREDAADSGGLFNTDARIFFPWGVRLASLFEECFIHMKRPGNFLHTDGHVSPFAAKLLSRLGSLFTRYQDALARREWTTPGHSAMLAADYLASGNLVPEGVFPQGPIYIAGFHALSGSENILFRHLWERRGARVILHGDPLLCSSSSPGHWSCQALADWASSWQSRLEPVPSAFPAGTDAPQDGPRFRYYQGFDLHSQLLALADELAPAASAGQFPDGHTLHIPGQDAPEPDGEAAGTEHPMLDSLADTVVVLPESGLLPPVLHHLPRVDVNISMGYPLTRSPLFRLLDTLLRLQENRKSSGYYWRDVVELIRHPYIKMLEPEKSRDGLAGTNDAGPDEPGQGDAAPLRRELQRLEQALRENGRKYLHPRETLLTFYQGLEREELPPAALLKLLDSVIDCCLTAFETPGTPEELAHALENLGALLLEHGAHLWKRFPIDAECLFRLGQTLIPELARSRLAKERFSPETLFTILRNLLAAERVPFEATPLVGLQLMGMLETRLLSFNRVIIVDAVENSLPGSPPGDPLLPEPLRMEIGLPPLHSREQVASYHFFRLLAGAKEAVLLWQEAEDAPGIQEARHKKSRFVEELLWNEEKARGRLLQTQGRDGPLAVLSSTIVPLPKHPRGIAVTPDVRRLMDSLLESPVSASLLDAYLRCPVNFYYERLVRLAPAGEVVEGDDPRAIGDLFHRVLQDAYTPLIGQALPGGEDLAAMLERELGAALFSSPEYRALADALPADSLAMLRAAGQKRLAAYLRNQPPTTVMALETPLAASFVHGGIRCSLTGKADRIDLRARPVQAATAPDPVYPGAKAALAAPARAVILDYKTGRTPEVAASFWQQDALWRELEAWRAPCAPFANEPEPLLAKVAGAVGSMQLPLYLLLYSLACEQGALRFDLPHGLREAPPAADAMWVALSRNGEEVPLMPVTHTEAPQENHVLQRAPGLVAFLLRHMRESVSLLPRPGEHCRWCMSAKLCKVAAPSGSRRIGSGLAQ